MKVVVNVQVTINSQLVKHILAVITALLIALGALHVEEVATMLNLIAS
jgi:hypothetical protein